MTQEITEWRRLVTFKKGTLLNAIAKAAIQIEDDLYQVGPFSFCIVDDTDLESDHLTIVSLLWACSVGAARRAYLNEVEADDLFVFSPPEYVFPGIKDGSCYIDILHDLKNIGVSGLMEHASYRVISDGIFVHKSIEFDKAIYYFRSQCVADINPPYAILWKMR